MLFSWRIEKMQGTYEYWMVHTKKNESEPGINGGMSRRKKPQEHTINYVEVDTKNNAFGIWEMDESAK